MAFQIEQVDQAKLDVLRTTGNGNIRVGEVVVVYWPAPTGPIAYAQLQYDELPEYRNITENERFVAMGAPPIEARFAARVFQRARRSSSIADSSTSFDFIDDDEEIARLCELHGEGVRCEIFFYFPQVDLMVSRWWGHLGAPGETGGLITQVQAAFGFRSSQLSLPKGARGSSCRFAFGGQLLTLEEIAENPCRYDRHLGGNHGLLDPEGKPYRVCPKTKAACLARIGDDFEYGGGDTASDIIIVNETKGPNVQARTRGNESNLSRARRVIFGEVKAHNLECLAFLVEPNTNHPDQGSARVLIDVCEGPVFSMTNFWISNKFVGQMHLNTRLGDYRQWRTAFSPNVNPYNSTALFLGVIQGNFVGWSGNQFTGYAEVKGLRDIRVYSDPVTFIEQYTDKPSWCILRMLMDKTWGDGQDLVRFHIQDWIDCDVWQSAVAGFTDASGNHYTDTRANFNAILEERTTQQQIADACLFSGLSLPFPFQGETRILPLKKEDLENVPVFTDDLELLQSDPTVRPILFTREGSSLRTRKVKPEGELTNQVIVNFLDAEHNNISRPLTFEDEPAMFAAGRAAGDNSRRVISKSYSALGITKLGQAVRAGNRLRDLGEFDEGGLYNNRGITFDASFLDTLDLHPYQVVKVVSKKLERYKQPFANTVKPFTYFRIQNMEDDSDLTVKMTCVAYPEDYYEDMEDETSAPTQPGPVLFSNPGGGRTDRPEPVVFDNVEFRTDRIFMKLSQLGVV